MKSSKKNYNRNENSKENYYKTKCEDIKQLPAKHNILNNNGREQKNYKNGFSPPLLLSQKR